MPSLLPWPGQEGGPAVPPPRGAGGCDPRGARPSEASRAVWVCVTWVSRSWYCWLVAVVRLAAERSRCRALATREPNDCRAAVACRNLSTTFPRTIEGAARGGVAFDAGFSSSRRCGAGADVHRGRASSVILLVRALAGSVRSPLEAPAGRVQDIVATGRGAADVSRVMKA